MDQLTPQQHRELIKSQIAQSYNNLEDCLEKGGEGSKGGKVIGHTKSGKPIYQQTARIQGRERINKFSDQHKDYSKQDHEDAAELHSQLAKKHIDQYNGEVGQSEGDSRHYTKHNLHKDVAESHRWLGEDKN